MRKDREEQIYNIALSFRNAIESAKRDGAFGRKSLLNRFPNGCCEHVSILLSEYLLKMGYECYLEGGKYYFDNPAYSEDYYDFQPHMWIVVDGTTIVDITGDQFKNNSFLLHYNETVYIGAGNSFYLLFSDEKIKDRPGIIDGWPPKMVNEYHEELKLILQYMKQGKRN